ncbi:MAG: acyl-CoA dehydrogenase family protein [Steroidobacteraceae bacterium]
MNAMQQPLTADAVPTEAELVERARALIPMLRARADEVESRRSVPPETIAEFKRAGFFKILQARRWGGWEMNPAVFFKVLMELGRGCSSSAWNMMILGVHQWEFGSMDLRAGDEIWARDNSVLIASSYPPFGKLTRVDGGWTLEGTWRTSSGCDHAEWAFIGAAPRTESGEPTDRYALVVHRSDYTILDDWHTFGLAGTGSKSLVIKKAFVPDYRCHSLIDYRLNDRGSMYLYPFNQIFWSAVSSVIVGFAQGAIDIYIEQMKVRKDNLGNAASLSHYVKDRLGNAVARVRSSRMRILQITSETSAYVTAGKLVPIEERVPVILDLARVGRECEEAVMLLFKATSARGIFLSNPLQRILRDTIAAANHITQNADDNAGLLGGYLLGEPLPPLSFTRDCA